MILNILCLFWFADSGESEAGVGGWLSGLLGMTCKKVPSHTQIMDIVVHGQ